MCEVRGVRCCFLEDVRARCAKYLLVAYLIVIILLALNIRVLFMLLSRRGPEDWNNTALCWSENITARRGEKPERHLDSPDTNNKTT